MLSIFLLSEPSTQAIRKVNFFMLSEERLFCNANTFSLYASESKSAVRFRPLSSAKSPLGSSTCAKFIKKSLLNVSKFL